VNVPDLVWCETFSCLDVEHDRYTVPPGPANPDEVTILMVAEAPPPDPRDWFYAGDDALYARTTVEAFRDAGEDVETIADVLELGVYLTTAIKCGKTGYGISSASIESCSHLLEEELGLFPLARALMLMGDTAIKAVNAIARRNREPRPVPAGATYRIRAGDYRFRGLRVFPSYVQAGPAFFIETSKRRMIAEDIAAALAYARALKSTHVSARRASSGPTPRRGCEGAASPRLLPSRRGARGAT
jgi:uracil-DNA glycosylase